ncbi:Uncharacterised protein [Mycobacteroides abscessus subsp. abscessus]|nr:Uncharacterised protein [Mycobacteroides abscessus subsp. abscessus]
MSSLRPLVMNTGPAGVSVPTRCSASAGAASGMSARCSVSERPSTVRLFVRRNGCRVMTSAMQALLNVSSIARPSALVTRSRAWYRAG